MVVDSGNGKEEDEEAMEFLKGVVGNGNMKNFLFVLYRNSENLMQFQKYRYRTGNLQTMTFNIAQFVKNIKQKQEDFFYKSGKSPKSSPFAQLELNELPEIPSKNANENVLILVVVKEAEW